ncbi:MAG: endonuclease/exonuclease/phosphatase family protein [Actinomycetia bacterium]|nr:endonuclease/exonuclease/phosphatase family protein [Actinomycetes bacterium]MCH9759393.1 endonuclease/exonuclease/phosphatase family protein [Actinomycetes bacterium]
MFSRTRVLVLSALAVVALAFAILTLVVRANPASTMPALIVAVGSPYTAFGALAVLVLVALRRRVLLSIIAAVVATASLAVQVNWYYFGRPPEVGDHTTIRMLSSNLFKGRADPSALVGFAQENADVITVAELTPEAVERFSQFGINETFAHSLLMPAPGAGGIGIWSKYPLTALSAPKLWRVKMPGARLRVPGVRFDPLLASVHVMSPVAGDQNTVDDWRLGMASAKEQLTFFGRVADPAAVIIGGDYNSTPDLRQFRDLLADGGYRDAVEQTGAGFAPTYPSDRWYPPVITIDHVLIRNAAAESIRTIDIPGADHRALLTTIQIPLDPTAS